MDQSEISQNVYDLSLPPIKHRKTLTHTQALTYTHTHTHTHTHTKTHTNTHTQSYILSYCHAKFHVNTLNGF